MRWEENIIPSLFENFVMLNSKFKTQETQVPRMIYPLSYYD